MRKVVFWVLFFSTALVLALAGVMFHRMGKESRILDPGQLHAFALWETPPFELVNCTGHTVTRDDLLGKVWIANFIFTRCPGPCPLMSRQMGALQAALEDHSEVRFVSFSVDPEFDRPEVLLDYARKWNADLARWFFLTGYDLDELQELARGFRVGLEWEAPGEGGGAAPETHSILHTTRFLLVDRQGGVRMAYDSTAPDFEERLLWGVQQLLGQPPKP